MTRARSTAARFDLPEIDAFTRPYWDAAGEGRLLLRRCRADGCGAAHHYPRELCPYCWSEDVVWEEASGLATLYTWSVVHRNDLPPFAGRLPYVAAVVDLAEGPRMMTEVTDCAEGNLRIGMRLRVHFRTERLQDGNGNGNGAGSGNGAGNEGGGGEADGKGGAAVRIPVFRP
ncbi:Zn-ribbon domain-containing OB-fold protein [Streptomyces sp. MST-110588]|uniref:Zn-ribbon domain-containing OB-fold protein n=1 Tax=Streptomyces sp. MST-110588 TaxID=2833628 RepID=UPI001F5D1D96|nr:Zn-ribbon domain-containing OB-fold protein [Streptomyces sp. MST-110588]UNO41419.1 Zn-ribbon domain-containing OB-fold protein [Streptomyces sp. MST-110588]